LRALAKTGCMKAPRRIENHAQSTSVYKLTGR
jgi:hypothetical protein